MNIIISTIILLLGGLGGFFLNNQPQGTWLYDNGAENFLLGATNFPTSLDALTNPASTDSVATVSHSGQHSNANDALEALEAKLGIGASTPVVNTVFVGTGTGSSGYSTFATTTSLWSTNLFANGSTTLQATTMGSTTARTNFLTSNATTTNLFVSNLASTTELRANIEVIGKSTIENLTVTNCTGCSAAGSVTLYTAISTSGVVKFKTLNLVAGDTVIFQMQSSSASNAYGSLSYRVSSPWSMASTTCTDYSATWTGPGHAMCVHGPATTTSTVTYGFSPATGATTYYTVIHQNTGAGNQF